MKVLSLNLWNINEPLATRTSALIAGVKYLLPDVICLQEVSPDPRSTKPQSEAIANECGFPHHAYSPSGCWKGRPEGLAIISRYSLANPWRTALPQFSGDMDRQIFLSEIEVSGRRVVIANTHLAFPLHMVRERLAQVDTLLAAIDAYATKNLVPSIVICGDFNDTADSSAVRAIVESKRNYYDAFATLHPRGLGYTFCSTNPHVDPRLGADRRIDYVFATPDIRLRECKIVFDGRNGQKIVSDHFGLLCSFSP